MQIDMKKDKKLDIFNKNELSINRKVYKTYNLLREDFQTEQEYDDFLEERTAVLYSMTHDADSTTADRTLEAFLDKHHKVIAQRNSQSLSLDMEFRLEQPLQSQVKGPSIKSRSAGGEGITAIQYSEAKYKNELETRLDNWEENADVPISVAGGLNPNIIFIKAREELMTSLFQKD